MKPLSEIHVCAFDRMSPKDVATLRYWMEHGEKWQQERALDMAGEAHRLQWRENAIPQVDALMGAGWLFESVHDDAEPWQWAWRRPARRAGSKGMRFASTNQAYQALRREKPELAADFQ